MSKIIFVITLGLIISSCRSMNYKTEIRNEDSGSEVIQKTLTAKYPQHQVLTAPMLDDNVESYFKKEYPNDKPGVICGTIRNKTEKGCVIVLVKKTGSVYDADLVVFANDQGYTEVLEDFSKEKAKHDDLFVTKVKNSDLIQDKNAPDFDQLTSGIKRVSYQKSAVIYYWENLRAKKLWVED